MTNSELLVLVLKSIPYPNQIQDIDLSIKDQIRFTWRENRFVVSDTLDVNICKHDVLSGDDIAIIFSQLLQKTMILIGV